MRSGRWQLWAECFESRFEVPDAWDISMLFVLPGSEDTNSRRKCFGALRWNQQIFAGTGNAFAAREVRRVDALDLPFHAAYAVEAAI